VNVQSELNRMRTEPGCEVCEYRNDISSY